MSNTHDIFADDTNQTKIPDIPCLIVPIANRGLLFPTVSVAEMLPFVKPQLRQTDLPSWFLGHVTWRGVAVPMFSYELISGEKPLPIKNTSQMAMLNSTGMSSALPFFCFPTQGIPRLSRVSPDSIKEDEQAPLHAFDEMNAVVSGESVAIPDVSKLEREIVALLGA
ncbi:MAG: chemosensory pili system protein ChpC [Granulosicoccus sp.]|jgi:chemosensory pili system protein ChpC